MAVIDIDKGWDKLIARVRMCDGAVTVGVQAGEVSKDGETDLATIAAAHEFGATIHRRSSTVTVYRRIKKDGSFSHGGRFVKASKSNFATTHDVGEYVIEIPKRSFIRSAFDENQTYIANYAEKKAAGVILGKYGKGDALNKVGQKVEGIVKKKMVDGPFQPLAPATIRRKRSSRPLIDTGRLRQSIRYKILGDVEHE